MNNSEAKLVLQAYRTRGQDAGDPLMAEALEQTRRDPELQKWFAQEQALDTRLQCKLVITVPPELKANLLALQKVSQPPVFWRTPTWLAAAAMVALLFGLAAVWLRPASPALLASFRDTMVGYSEQQTNHVTLMSADPTKVQQWLQAQGFGGGFDLPPGLVGKATMGCRIVDWNGRKGALICFMLEGGHHVDLFVMDRGSLPGLAENGSPQFSPAGGEMTVTWASHGRAYMLTGGGEKEFLQKLLTQT